jgi:hypothetical protein
MTTSALLVLVSLFGIRPAPSEQAGKRITIKQAEALVIAALSPQQRRLPNIEAEADDTQQPSRFIFFIVTWAGTPNGSVVVGNYAVDPATGDVFSATRECYEFKTKELRSLQLKIRAALQLSEEEYQQRKSKGPLCER